MKTKYCLMLLVLLAFAACKKDTVKKEVTKTPVTNVTNPPIDANTISFSGYTWTVKNTGNSTMGPGPNYWNKQNVWVDADGWLHLKLSKNTTTNRWECAEVISTRTFGYGTYQWQVDGPVNALNRNVVLGLFNYNGVDGLHEMDIEFARWGVQTNLPLNYTIYPASVGNATFHQEFDFTMSGTFSTHRFKRNATSVVYKSMDGFYDDDTNLFATATCEPPYQVSTVAMPIYMNLWLFQGRTPTDNANVEIVIRSFKFTPL